MSHAACSVGVLPLLLPPASSMSSGFILLAGSLLLTKAQFSPAALPSEVSLPLHIVKADVVLGRLLASAGNRGAARLQRGAALLSTGGVIQRTKAKRCKHTRPTLINTAGEAGVLVNREVYARRARERIRGAAKENGENGLLGEWDEPSCDGMVRHGWVACSSSSS